jgi:hypothetical protein
MDRLEKLKQNSIENPGKSKRGCKDCKKPKEVVVEKVPLPFELEIYIPSVEEIKTAYVMLSNLKNDEKPYIQKVFNAIFNEEFDFNCPSCIHTQTRMLQNYIRDVLKLKL